MVDVGLAVTEDPVVALRPVAGLHVYDIAPLAVITTLSPVQIVGEAGVTETVGVGETVIVIVVLSWHVPEAPTTE